MDEGREAVIVEAGPPGGRPSARVVAQAAEVLRSGGLVALPTDTVYGLAALPGVEGATAALFALKRRGGDVPVAVLCASAPQALMSRSRRARANAVRSQRTVRAR